MAPTLGNYPFYLTVFCLMFAVSSLAALAPNMHQWLLALRQITPNRILFRRQDITAILCPNIFGKTCTGPPKYFYRRLTPIAWRDSQASQTTTLGRREWSERPGVRGLQDCSKCSWTRHCDLSQFPYEYVVAQTCITTLINVHAIALIQAIDFYMDEKRTKERAEIIRLSNLESPSANDNDKLMGYIREAQS